MAVDVVVEVGGVRVSARRISRGMVCHPSVFLGKTIKIKYYLGRVWNCGRTMATLLAASCVG